jgi:hypothetical protein
MTKCSAKWFSVSYKEEDQSEKTEMVWEEFVGKWNGCRSLRLESLKERGSSSSEPRLGEEKESWMVWGQTEDELGTKDLWGEVVIYQPKSGFLFLNRLGI